MLCADRAQAAEVGYWRIPASRCNRPRHKLSTALIVRWTIGTRRTPAALSEDEAGIPTDGTLAWEAHHTELARDAPSFRPELARRRWLRRCSRENRSDRHKAELRARSEALVAAYDARFPRAMRLIGGRATAPRIGAAARTLRDGCGHTEIERDYQPPVRRDVRLDRTIAKRQPHTRGAAVKLRDCFIRSSVWTIGEGTTIYPACGTSSRHRAGGWRETPPEASAPASLIDSPSLL